MKRTQLYLNDELYRYLSTLSRQEKKTISELVRSAITEKYLIKDTIDKVDIVDRLAGIWKNREDMRSAEKYVRALRKDTRKKRLKE